MIGTKERSFGPVPVYFAKGVRVYVSGLLSIIIPFYLGTLGYGLYIQGVVLVAILAGNALSNVTVTYLEAPLGSRHLLQVFSALMIVSGVTLAFSTSLVAVIVACIIGNISNTGTEAGPFQSIEAGVLPDLASESSAVKVFGRYNLVGYSAAAVGQLTSSVPGLVGNTHVSFQVIFLAFAVVGFLLLLVYSRILGLKGGSQTRPGLANLDTQARKDVVNLSGLFAADAFGGVFVSTYLLSIWFHVSYGLDLTFLGPIFFIASVVAAGSTYAASAIAERIGNLRTMVYTHLISSTFLILMAVAGSLLLATAFLFLRQSLSQMDVPTRQALMTEMFQRDARVQAYAVTNTLRSAGSFLGGPVAAGILNVGFVSGLLFAGGGSKILYDLAIFARYRRRYR
ncbi:MAG TPA: MFS transporter [Nitrososphaerales archaeon]|nr:MFS transporter [Nitrososphaerales archaeon]